MMLTGEERRKMGKNIWVNKVESFDEAQEFDDDYYLSMSSKERLETMQLLREMHFKMKKGLENEGRKRLRRIIKITEQT